MPFIATSTLHFEHTRKNQTPMEKRLSSISKQLVSYQHLSFIPLLMFARYKVSLVPILPPHYCALQGWFLNMPSHITAPYFFTPPHTCRHSTQTLSLIPSLTLCLLCPRPVLRPDARPLGHRQDPRRQVRGGRE